MALVPVYEVNVVGWSECETRVDNGPHNEVWLVNTRLEGKSKRVWFKDGSEIFRRLCERHSLSPTDIDDVSIKAGFVKGNTLCRDSVTLPTCGGQDRPDTLWLVIHSGSPNGGLKAGGYERAKTNAFSFQPMLQRHLNCARTSFRDHSPFLHLTDDYDKARESCVSHEILGHEGIKILQVDTSHGGWKHAIQRMWHARGTCELLQITGRGCQESDYLIENSIPVKAIVETISWDKIRGHPKNKELIAEKDAVREQGKRSREKRKERDAAARKARTGVSGGLVHRLNFKRCKGFRPLRPENQRARHSG